MQTCKVDDNLIYGDVTCNVVFVYSASMDTKEREVTGIARVIVEMPPTLKTEFVRLAKSRHDRGAGPMVRELIRNWIASEQAAEAEEAAA